MKYKIKNITSISKFNILWYNSCLKGWDNYSFSDYFWRTIFDKDFFENFIYNQYLNSKKVNFNESNIKKIRSDFKFIYNKLEYVNKRVDFVNNDHSPTWEDIFFMYRIFKKIISYYNNFYSDNWVEINLSRWIIFKWKLDNIKDYLDNIDYYFSSEFINDFIVNIIKESLLKRKWRLVYKFSIFWPDELVTVWLISKILKKYNSSSKIIVDFSASNEQFDFSQWVNVINENWKKIFQIIDFFIFYRDYGKSTDSIIKYLNDDESDLDNVMYFNNWSIIFEHRIEKELNSLKIEKFISNTFNKSSINIILLWSHIMWRFLPYKCYWSKCNFCTINSQNTITFDKDFSYEYFIDKWINFIEKYNIKSVTFKDEAVPPNIIISFAKRILEKNLSVIYHFRTRFDLVYNLFNCKILYKSWARFCWMWLESASERINENIWNKWNNWLKLKDKLKIIHCFDSVWISVHNYSIIWFPWETLKESGFTYKFLKVNIDESNFFTCTPNIFWLMKWSKIFKDRKKIWIEIEKNDLNSIFKLDYNFKYNWQYRDIYTLSEIQNKIHFSQFTPWLSGKSREKIDSTDFWNFIDRSFIFYLLKRYNRINPFLKFKSKNSFISTLEYNEILQLSFFISEYLQVICLDNKKYLFNWVTNKSVILKPEYEDMINKYENWISLIDNLNKSSLNLDDDIKNFVYSLLESRILCKLEGNL